MLKLIRSCQRVPQSKIDKFIQMVKDFFFYRTPNNCSVMWWNVKKINCKFLPLVLCEIEFSPKKSRV